MKNEQRIGIIDTISLGYGLVNRRPWLIVLPVLLDLLLWLGPRLSMQPTTEALAGFLAPQLRENADMLADLRAAGAQSDLLGLLAVQVPSLIRLLNPDSSPILAQRPVLALTGLLTTLTVALLLLIVGLLLTMLYLTPIAQVVRSGSADPRQMPRLAGRAWLRLLLLMVLLVGVGLLVTVPLSVLVGLLSLVGLNLFPLVVTLLWVGAIWLLVYLFFVIDAIVVSEVGPLRAIQYSIAVVRHNFWSSLGLILLSVIISAGLGRVFELFTQTTIGVPVAIIANAYIASGLAAASMIFYRDRLARWQHQRGTILRHTGPPPTNH